MANPAEVLENILFGLTREQTSITLSHSEDGGRINASVGAMGGVRTDWDTVEMLQQVLRREITGERTTKLDQILDRASPSEGPVVVHATGDGDHAYIQNIDIQVPNAAGELAKLDANYIVRTVQRLVAEQAQVRDR